MEDINEDVNKPTGEAPKASSQEETKVGDNEDQPETRILDPAIGNPSLDLEDEDVNNDELTPPPDSPVEDSGSHVSSAPHNALHDEIIVGTNMPAPIDKSSPLRVTSDQEDNDMDDMEDVDDMEDQEPVSHYPKRKRASLYDDLAEDKIEDSMDIEEPEVEIIRRTPKPSNASSLHGVSKVKGVILGYWRDSPAPDDKDKHEVIGFIDSRDRLRTRAQPTSRSHEVIIDKYPLPPGPGGSWVTFGRVCFDPHLVNLDHYQVKEYVKIRAETYDKRETEEETKERDNEAVKEAIRRVQENPAPADAPPPLIAYGREIPEHALIPRRPEPKKRRIGSTTGTLASVSAPSPSVQANGTLDPLHGTRPTSVQVGFWKGSSEPNDEDKHAVFGILGTNDMFRVKVIKKTRDGRDIEGNFPAGAGALWIHWEYVEFEPHLRGLSRPEIKEYVRVRQWQVDQGERREDKLKNEAEAVIEARRRASLIPNRKPGEDPSKHRITTAVPKEERLSNGSGQDDSYDPRREYNGHELRQSRRSEPVVSRVRHSLPEAGLRAANRPHGVDTLARTNHIARREIDRAEQAQARQNQRAAAEPRTALIASSSVSLNDHRANFEENIDSLNRVWANQEAQRLQAGTEDAKIYNGIKYERKQTGPFVGKLVSQGSIITIDGDDYVEYRVLTKPSFNY